MIMDKFYTVQEAADYLKVHRTSIIRLIKNGKLKAVNIAPTGTKYKTWRIHDSSLIKFMNDMNND